MKDVITLENFGTTLLMEPKIFIIPTSNLFSCAYGCVVLAQTQNELTDTIAK